MNSRQQTTLSAVFDGPTRANVAWSDIESLFRARGGSRVRVALNGVRAVFHRPHPEKETDRGAVRSVRDFLTEAGVAP